MSDGTPSTSRIILPLEVHDTPASVQSYPSTGLTGASTRTYSPERQRDAVRLVVTAGLLLILGYLVVFATVESASSNPARWNQAKEMLQILLPALTGIIGTVIGFYFGTSATRSQSGDQ